jgi:hypothetical protein
VPGAADFLPPFSRLDQAAGAKYYPVEFTFFWQIIARHDGLMELAECINCN